MASIGLEAESWPQANSLTNENHIFEGKLSSHRNGGIRQDKSCKRVSSIMISERIVLMLLLSKSFRISEQIQCKKMTKKWKSWRKLGGTKFYKKSSDIIHMF